MQEDIKSLLIIILLITSLVLSKRSKQERIDSYNSGFRAGKMDVLAEQLECQGMFYPEIIKLYKETSDLLKAHGELDMTPRECEGSINQ